LGTGLLKNIDGVSCKRAELPQRFMIVIAGLARFVLNATREGSRRPTQQALMAPLCARIMNRGKRLGSMGRFEQKSAAFPSYIHHSAEFAVGA